MDYETLKLSVSRANLVACLNRVAGNTDEFLTLDSLNAMTDQEVKEWAANYLFNYEPMGLLLEITFTD